MTFNPAIEEDRLALRAKLEKIKADGNPPMPAELMIDCLLVGQWLQDQIKEIAPSEIVDVLLEDLHTRTGYGGVSLKLQILNIERVCELSGQKW